MAGCYVTDGSDPQQQRNSCTTWRRCGSYRKIEALKRFKNDASEVKAGTECGISLVNYNGVQIGDIIRSILHGTRTADPRWLISNLSRKRFKDPGP